MFLMAQVMKIRAYQEQTNHNRGPWIQWKQQKLENQVKELDIKFLQAPVPSCYATPFNISQLIYATNNLHTKQEQD